MSRFLRDKELISYIYSDFSSLFSCSVALLVFGPFVPYVKPFPHRGNIKCFNSCFWNYSFLIIYFLFFSLGHISRHLSLSSRKQHLLMGSFRQLWAWKLYWTDPSVCTCQPRRMPGNGLDCLDRCFLASELVLVASVFETKTSLACLELNIWY